MFSGRSRATTPVKDSDNISPSSSAPSDEGDKKNAMIKQQSPAKSSPSHTSPQRKSSKPTTVGEFKEKFQTFQKTLKNLIAALKSHHESLNLQRKTHNDVVRLVTSLAKETPLEMKDAPTSYHRINEALDQTFRSFQDRFEDKVLNYAIEWEKLMTIKFTADLKKAEECRRNLDHYEKKVDNLSSKNEKDKARQKDLPAKSMEKLERNQDKLEDARRENERAMSNLDRLFEEFIDRSWKDLYPLLVSLLSFDSEFSQEKEKALENVRKLLDELARVARENKVSRESRSASGLWRSIPAEWH